MKTVWGIAALLFLLTPLMQTTAATREWIVYVGTYNRQNSKGIYAYRFTPSDGKLTPLGLAVETANASFLAVHPNQRFLYAVGENNSGTVSSFAIDGAEGKLRLLNTVSTRGSGPCHLAFDRTGRWIFVANYTSGSIASFPVRNDGTLGEAAVSIQHSGSSVDRQRQNGPHAHSVNISPDNRFLVVTDLGLDQVLVYRFDAIAGSLAPNTPPFVKMEPGAGPRHLTFSPDGRFGWVLNEITATVTSMSYDKTSGAFAVKQSISALPPDFSGARSGAEILIHPNGRFLYTSIRGHDTIASFSVDSQSGLVTPAAWIPTRGKTPRNFAIEPDGNYLLAANQDSNSIAVYRLDTETGGLSPVGEVLGTPVPVSIVFAASR